MTNSVMFWARHQWLLHIDTISMGGQIPSSGLIFVFLFLLNCPPWKLSAPDDWSLLIAIYIPNLYSTSCGLEAMELNWKPTRCSWYPQCWISTHSKFIRPRFLNRGVAQVCPESASQDCLSNPVSHDFPIVGFWRTRRRYFNKAWSHP